MNLENQDIQKGAYETARDRIVAEVTESKETPKTQTRAERLRSLGLKKAADNIGVARKQAIAYEHFRYVTPEQIGLFQEKLRKDTQVPLDVKKTQEHPWREGVRYKALKLVRLEDFGAVPPDAALEKLEAAQKLGCFESFEVAKIEWVEEVKDPILFGRVQDCDDRFYICQWDSDVSIEEIISEDEG